MKKEVVFAGLFAGVIILQPFSAVLADSTSTNPSLATGVTGVNPSCGITPDDLAAIKAVQNDPSLSYGAEMQQELALRKNLLTRTIQCAEISAQQLQTDLSGTSVNSGLENIKSQLLNDLNGASTYYSLQLQKVNVSGISGTKIIAQEVLTWRENNYAPLSENVMNFIAWSDNQRLFTTAQDRLAQINNLIASPLFSENTDIQKDYQEAVVSLKAAQDQNQYAKNAFAESLPPGQALIFIKNSLDLLSSTYQHFFDISNLIQSLLPH